MDHKLTATARVQVTVEITLHDSWGADCTVGQLHDQAARIALAKLHKTIGEGAGVRVVDSPRVTMVTVKHDDT